MNKESPNGWFCPAALKWVKYSDYYADPSKPHYGYKSWHDWFIREVKPEARPIDTDPNVIVNSSDSYPIIYPPANNDKDYVIQGTNPTLDAKEHN